MQRHLIYAELSFTAFGLSLTDINQVMQTGVLLVGFVAGVIGIINGLQNKKRK